MTHTRKQASPCRACRIDNEKWTCIARKQRVHAHRIEKAENKLEKLTPAWQCILLGPIEKNKITYFKIIIIRIAIFGLVCEYIKT